MTSMNENANGRIGPKGRLATEAAQGRARRSEEYRDARDEYAAIRALREKNWIAAHIRERRYELDLTQQEVAERAKTSTPSSRKSRAATTCRRSRCSGAFLPCSTRSC
jgi:hypothetical protein